MADPTQGRTASRLLLGCLLAMVALGAAAEDSVARWYQVEVVIFRNDSALAEDEEKLFRADVRPQWPAGVSMLLPADNDALRPRSTQALQLAWQTQPPHLTLLDFGLDADTHLATALGARVATRRSRTDLGFLANLDQLSWSEPDAEPSIDRAEREQPPAPEPEPDEPRDPELERIAEALPEIPEIPPQWAFRQVEGGERLLGQEVARLQRARDYEVLERLSWRQPFFTDEPGNPVMVDIQNAQSQLLGSVSVDLRRFLHTHVDLYFRAEDLADAGEWLHLRQSRRMRSGETHYLDHPRIGVLVRIERL